MTELASPAFEAYTITAVVLCLHLVGLALWTGTIRTFRKTYVNAEDARLNKTELAVAEADDVARSQRVHRNALENALPFFVVGGLYALTGPSAQSAWIYFGTFLGARLLHSVFYFGGIQPFRTLSFGVGVLAIIGMSVQVLF